MSRELKDSEVRWIGQIPENWGVLPLKRLAKIQTGSSPDKKEGNANYSDECGTPWIKAENLDTFEPIHNTTEYLTDIGRKNGRIYPPYTVFICCIASIGKVGYSDIESSCNQQINGLVFYSNTNWKFGFYAAIASTEEHNVRSNKSVTPILNSTEQGNIKFALPPIPEQRQIVSFLDRKCSAIDTAIEKTKKSIEKLEEYKKAVITKAVTKGLDPDAKMKDSGLGWIGDIPETWTVSKFKYHTIQKSDRNPGDATVLSLYREYGIVIKDSRDDNHNRTSLDTSSYRYVEVNDFVVNKMKAWQGSVAVSEYEGIVSPAYYVYRITDQELYPRYLHYLIRSCYKDEFMRLSGGIRIGQWDLPADALGNTMILKPSYTEQKAISDYIDKKTAAVEALIAKKQEAISKWEEYKKSLIYYAVTGKIECRNEVIDVES